MSYAHCTAWIKFFTEQATGVTLILWNILLPIKVAILWSTLCEMCEMCFYFYWYEYETINCWFLESLRLISRYCEADFERWLINHLNSIDLSKSTPTPNGTGAIVMCGRDACVIDWQIPIFLTLMVWQFPEVEALNYWMCFWGVQHLKGISLDNFGGSNDYINKNFNWILSQFV